MIFDWLFPKEKEKAKPPEPKDFVGSLNTRFWDGLHAFPPFELFWQTTILARHFDLTFPYNRLLEEALYKSVFHVYMALPKSLQLTKAEIIRAGEEWEENEWQTKPGLTVPLHDVIDVPNCIMHVMSNFVYDTAMRSGDVATPLRQQLQKNEYQAAGVSQYEARTKGLTLLHQHEMEPREHLYAAFKDTPFLEFFNVQVPFTIGKKALSEHCFIVAKPGHGKTVLLSAFAAQFLNDPSKPGLFCLDPAGDWFEKLRDRVPPDRLVVLDPETNPPPLNFFDFKNTSVAAERSFGYLMSSLSGGLSDKQGAIVPYLLKLLRNIPDASLETLRLIVDEKVKRPELSHFATAIKALPTVDQGFFHSQFYHSSMDPTKQAISWKIYSAMSSDAFRAMFGATENCFDANAAMRDGKVVLVRGSELTLGEDGLSVFLQYIVSQFFLASLARFRIPENQRRQCYLLCDEAKHIYNHQVERVLTECRKLGLSFFSATQVIDQIPTEVKAAIYGATSIKAAGNVSFSDASMLAREMRTSPGFIQGMKTFEWAFHVGDSDKSFKVRVPYGALEAMPKQKPLDDAQMFQHFKTAIADEAEEIEGKPKSTAPLSSLSRIPVEAGSADEARQGSTVSESVSQKHKAPEPTKQDGSWLWDKGPATGQGKGQDDDIPTSAPGGWKK